jgi:aminopeptidase YwaD
MKAKWVVLTGIFCLALAAGILLGQEKEDRTLLSHDQMTAIINEVSGERAMHHVLELVPYQFVRPPSEYQGHFRESEVMAKFAREYGFSNVAIEDYPTGQTYQPVVGELWTTTPKSVKIFDIHASCPTLRRQIQFQVARRRPPHAIQAAPISSNTRDASSAGSAARVICRPITR